MSKFHPCLYLDQPTAPFAETVRSLRANVMQLLRKSYKSFLVTSCWEGEGKSTVCINLSAALCEFGLRVLLVDGDLRQRTLTRLLLEDTPGPELCVQDTPWIPKLAVVGAPLCKEQNAADTLGQPAFKSGLQALFGDYDVIIMDSPPLAVCSDALLMGRWLDGALMVTSQSKFRGVAEGNYSEDLRDSGVEILGIVTTGVPLESR